MQIILHGNFLSYIEGWRLSWGFKNYLYVFKDIEKNAA